MSEPFSVVVPVLNDVGAMAELLTALERQSRAADEIVVVDGGSSDGTQELVERWRRRLPLRLVVEEGNISHARNVGVRSVSSGWVACTDAGVCPAPAWLEAFDRAREGADFLAGVYRVQGETDTEGALAAALYPSVDEIGSRSRWLRLWQAAFGKRWAAAEATGRSMAFTRAAWKAGGGFPEHLYAGEDVAFSAAVVSAGQRARLVPGAVVDWRPRATWAANARMYATYARGNVREGGRGRHLIRAATWLSLPVLVARGGTPGRAAVTAWAIAYASVPINRARRRDKGLGVICRIPLAIVMKDLSQIAGAALGLLDASRRRSQPTPTRVPEETA